MTSLYKGELMLYPHSTVSASVSERLEIDLRVSSRQ